MASQIAAVIPSHAMRRVAAIDDEGRGPAAANMRDQPVVVWNWFAGARSFTGPDLNRMIESAPPGRLFSSLSAGPGPNIDSVIVLYWSCNWEK